MKVTTQVNLLYVIVAALLAIQVATVMHFQKRTTAERLTGESVTKTHGHTTCTTQETEPITLQDVWDRLSPIIDKIERAANHKLGQRSVWNCHKCKVHTVRIESENEICENSGLTALEAVEALIKYEGLEINNRGELVKTQEKKK